MVDAMTFNRSLFSTERTNWKTPKALLDELDKEFNFDFDPCPSDNANFNGLEIDWKERNYINPPYGRVIGLWIEKAYRESLKGKICVMLLPARTDTKWFHNIIMPYASEIRFLKGRLKFDDQENSAPFPSMIVVFGVKKTVISG